MKSTWLLLVGIAIGALGCGTYFSSSNRERVADASDPVATSTEVSANASRRAPRKNLWPEWNPNKGKGRSQTISDKGSSADRSSDQKPDSKAAPSVATRPLISNSPRPIGGVAEPTEEELIVSAEQVEARANRELDRLARLLDLTEEQQDRIFPLLARSSTAYHPALAIRVGDAESSHVSNLPAETSTGAESAELSSSDSGSEPLQAKEADEEIHEVLSDDQQAALEEAIIDEDLWWTDIINDLEDELDESTQLAASEAAAEEAAATAAEEDTSYSGNSGIGGLLGN